MLALPALVLLAQLQPGETTGAVYAYEGDGRRGAKLFDVVRRTTRTRTGWAASMEFRRPSGQLAVKERVDLDDDLRPTAYRREQYQTGSRGRVQVKGDRVHYWWRSGEDGARRESERVSGDLMVGPMMFAYFRKHWAQIKNGERIEFRILVPDRLTSYRFGFQRVGYTTHQGRRLAECKLSLGGLLGLFAGDMTFYLDAETGDIRRYAGIVLPKVRDDDGEWVNVKAVVEYGERRVRSLAKAAPESPAPASAPAR